MNDSKSCSFCQKELKEEKKPSGNLNDAVHYDCPRCGWVYITDRAQWGYDKGFLENNGHLISGALRWRSVNGLKNKNPLKSEDIEDMARNAEIPKKILDRIDKVVEYIGMKTHDLGQVVKIVYADDYPIAFCRSKDEFMTILSHLRDTPMLRGSIPSGVDGGYQLTVDGLNRYYELEKRTVDTLQCFVAMNFNPKYDPIYKKIEEAILACGFKPYCVNGMQTNDDITDLIIAGIKKSRFVVVDFSGERPSAYFEAGFAKGLGKEVIWMCEENGKLHFDTQQYSHIIWKDGEDLKKKLIDRIEATIK